MCFFSTANANQVCDVVKGALLVAQGDKNTVIGKITNAFDSDSIFNEFGNYGSEFSSNSIWNQFGNFGSEFSRFSPHNQMSSTPPMIIKGGKVIGFLSSDKSLRATISPNLLKALCKDEM
jgi:hypothetical protein